MRTALIGKNMIRPVTLLTGLVLSGLVHAADLRVEYNVDPKTLNSAVAGGMLAFELYSDNTCTTLVTSESIDVADPSVMINKMTLRKVKKGPAALKVARLEHVMSGVSISANMYLKVTGTGILAVGSECQIQSATYAAALTCMTTTNTTTSVTAGGVANVTAANCPAGYTQTSTNCESGSWDMPFVFTNGGTCSAKNLGSSAAELRASRTCCKVQ